MSRPPKPETHLTVTHTQRISPGMVRVDFRSSDLSAFERSVFTDRYVKLVFPQRDGSAVLRTYTVLDPSPVHGTLSIEFVTHSHGYAGPWAATAQPGDVMTVRGPGGLYYPDPTADWHLLAGDEAGLPAIRAALAALPSDARGYAVIEVSAESHIQPLEHPAGVEVTWLVADLHNSPGDEIPWVAAVRALPWLKGRVHAFVHGEAHATMRGVRPYLLQERRVPRKDMSISGYWRRGDTEESFRAWKRTLAAQEALQVA